MPFTQRAAELWRDYEEVLNPASQKWTPPKPGIRTWGTEVENGIEAAAEGAAGAAADIAVVAADVESVGDRVTILETQDISSTIIKATWSELSALSGSFAGQKAEVPSTDAGTHTDPVVGGTKANAGVYTWSASPAGWKWIAADGLSTKADKVGASLTNPTTNTPASTAVSTEIPNAQWVAEGGTAIPADAEFKGGYTTGFEIEASGDRLIRAKRPDGTEYISLSPDAVAELMGKVFPDPAVISGVLEPMSPRLRKAYGPGKATEFTAVEFTARMTPGGVERPYIQRIDPSRVGSTSILNTRLAYIRLHLFYGQSLNEGYDVVSPTIINGTPPRPNDALMFNTGTRGSGAIYLDDGAMKDFAPAYEQPATVSGVLAGETAVTAALRWRGEYRDANSRPPLVEVGRTVGAGSRSLAQLSPGGSDLMFGNGSKTSRKGTWVSGRYGKRMLLPSIYMNQGENDRTLGTSRATYGAGLISLLASMNNFVNGSTPGWRPIGQSDLIKMYIVQLCAPSVTGATTASDIALAQMDAARSDPNIRLIHAPTWEKHSDALHGRGAMYAGDGEYYGYYTQMEDDTGLPAQGLGVWMDWEFAGNTLAIRPYKDAAKTIPWTGLVVDTTTIAPAPGWGLKIGDGSGDRTVTSVNIVANGVAANAQIIANFSGAAISTGGYWSNALDGPGIADLAHSGAWTNIRDSNTAESKSLPGKYLWNKLLITKDTV